MKLQKLTANSKGIRLWNCFLDYLFYTVCFAASKLSTPSIIWFRDFDIHYTNTRVSCSTFWSCISIHYQCTPNNANLIHNQYNKTIKLERPQQKPFRYPSLQVFLLKWHSIVYVDFPFHYIKLGATACEWCLIHTLISYVTDDTFNLHWYA